MSDNKLIKEFTFYGQYHTNKINVLIHICCVPCIFFTSLVLSHKFGSPSFARMPLDLPGIGPETLDITPAFLVAAAYATYFVLLEPVAGILYAPILLAMGHYSNVWYALDDGAIRKAGIAFTAAWIAQFIGHGKFEGRAPALFDSLFQSLVLAVFFVWLECLFALGYRPALHKKLQNSIGKAVLEYRKSQKAQKPGMADGAVPRG